MFLVERGKLAHQDGYLVRILDGGWLPQGRCGGHVAVHGRDNWRSVRNTGPCCIERLAPRLAELVLNDLAKDSAA